MKMKSIILLVILATILLNDVLSRRKFKRYKEKANAASRMDYNKLGPARYIMYGYNQRNSEFFIDDLDPGITKNPIFELAAEPEDFKIDARVENVPKGLTVSAKITEMNEIFTSSVSSQSEYLRTVSLGLTSSTGPAPTVTNSQTTNSDGTSTTTSSSSSGLLSGGLGPYAFTGSASYKSVTKGTILSGKEYVYKFSRCTTHNVMLNFDAEGGLKLTQAFINAAKTLENLDLTKNEHKEKLKTFFNSYGSRYIIEMDIGGKTLETSTDRSWNLQAGPAILTASFGIAINENQVRGLSDELNKKYSSGKYDADGAGSLPVRYKFGNIFDLINDKVENFKDESKKLKITDKEICELYNLLCKPVDPIWAVTGLTYFSTNDNSKEMATAGACDTQKAEDATNLASHLVKSKRVNLHSQNAGQYKYLCQKKENIVTVSDGKIIIKPYIIYKTEGNLIQPTVFNESPPTDEGWHCIVKIDQTGLETDTLVSKINNPHDMSKKHAGTRYICWKQEGENKDAKDEHIVAARKNSIKDFGVTGWAPSLFKNDCQTQISHNINRRFLVNRQFANVDFVDYTCFCRDLNVKGTISNYYALCWSAVPDEQKIQRPVQGNSSG